ncbi:hypothetical protein PHET_05370 [Paragonimus heterotremus]|uniref:Uncharacterized protein n=1 Tax=Paragonimus heterotremus TaxID=100268 RepID=A0A8J4WZQ4_9TREM|nr:hypothetical protein PHET_05370 [Paragonimus heterotremus]
MWCRTVASQPNGQSMFEAAMATGSFDLVRQIDRARTTNELVAASIALDVDYVKELLGARIERDKCDLETKDRGQDPPRSLIAELRLTLGDRGNEMSDLLRSYGLPHEQLYLDELEREKDAFDQCPFVRAVSKATTREELDKSWALIDDPGFKASRRRRRDHAGYLHFLVEQYLATSSNPVLQRGLVRLMFKIALTGVNIQTRDDLGRTALTLAAHSILNTSTTSLEETALITRFPGPSLSDTDSADVKNENERAEQINHEGSTQFEPIPDPTGDALEVKTSSGQESTIMGEKGVDSSIGNLKNECVHREFYVPRDCFTLRPRNSRVLHVDPERSGCVAAIEGLPGIWPVLDDMIRAITNGQPMSVCESLLSQIRQCLQNNLVHVRSTRCGLETVELAKAAIPRHLHRHSLFTQPPSANCDSCTSHTETDGRRTPGQKLIQLLQSYVGISDFAMAAMAGDLARMKCCLALGDSARKVKSYVDRYYNGIDPTNLRAMFVPRPLIVSVMDYSTTEAVELMLTYGADLTEFYSASQPPGPVAFWAFQETVPLRTTLKVVKTAPLDIRDAHGGTMLHRAVRIFHQLEKADHNGHLWASLILLVLLNRGVRVELRDCWARTARDVAVSRRRSIADQCMNINGQSLRFRNVEHQTPDLYELRELIDPITGQLLTPEAIIDRRVAQLAYWDYVDMMEDLIIHQYDCIHTARLGFPQARTASEVAESRGHTDMVNLLKQVDRYRAEVMEIQRAVIEGNQKVFARMTPEKRLVWCCDWRGRSLLHLAVIFRRTQIALRLADLCPQLAQGRDCFGRTPMHYAICIADNRRLFLKLTAKLGGVDKQMKDFRDVSIATYADRFERDMHEYRTLIQREQEARVPEHLRYMCVIQPVDDVESLPRDSSASSQQTELVRSPRNQLNNETTSAADYHALAFPSPGAFYSKQLQKSRSLVRGIQ